MITIPNERHGVDAGCPFLFAFLRAPPRATQAGCSAEAGEPWVGVDQGPIWMFAPFADLAAFACGRIGNSNAKGAKDAKD